MKRLVAAAIVAVFAATPVLAAWPSGGMMQHCMTMAMPCHDMAALSCCATRPAEPATPAARTISTVTGTPSNPSLQVVAVVAVDTLPGAPLVNASPPHGYQPGDLLHRLSTLLI